MTAPGDVLPPRIQTPDVPTDLRVSSDWSAHGDYELVRFTDLTPEIDATDVGLTQCHFPSLRAETVTTPDTWWADVHCEHVNVVQFHARKARLNNVLFDQGRVAVLDLNAAKLNSVTISGLKIDYLALAGAELHDVDLTNCQIRTLDLPDANCTRVRITECDIDEFATRNADLKHVDVRTSNVVSFTDPGDLRGVVMTPRQAVALAVELAHAHGIWVRDED